LRFEVTENSGRAALLDQPHRRFNALTGDSVFVSPHRTERPWGGKQERVDASAPSPAYDPGCPLCPGNARANGGRNPEYASTYVWANDFPAFLPDNDGADMGIDPLMRAQGHAGECRVICYSPRHDVTLAQMPVAQIRSVIDTWAAQTEELESRWRWVQVFENKGEIMGCSNPHPHGQIWASSFLPHEPAKELARQQAWFRARGTPLLLDYAQREVAMGDRTVLHNDHWLVVVPWWAVWPFETLVLPRWPVTRLPALNAAERDALAQILSRLLCAYDRLFDTSFPYSFGWHGAPSVSAAPTEEPAGGWQLHAHFYPPLLRSATVKKFMVGYELLAEVQRDITPEWAASELRDRA
jgi:UDPglucose--hexose-1-phosphate uridylyltransferase